MTTLALPGYDLGETLYKGTRTLVYRGTRHSDNQPVILKFLRNEYPTFSELVQFRNQYTIAKNLDLPGIVQPLALETYGHGYALVMADEGYISLGEWQQRKFSGELDIADFLIIAIQLAGILRELYQNRVIHKDIKPANILIHPDTKQVKLIDFSIASLLPKETQEISNPNVLEGTLAYISPEQTGRMNRGIDYRTDFYSLGVTFYELLTGELPFQSEDPMELVHAHIAKSPTFSHTQHPTPNTLLDIIGKLMAKNAEDRYQSALGLKYDLEKCLSQWKDTGNIEPFDLGERDICDRFIIPEKLYGRDAEVQTLLDAFERVTHGVTEMMLVAGFSGIGKTAVVNEVHKPITRARGYFIKGKFDQFNRNIPFSAFVQAFRNLMSQLLGQSDADLANTKAKILKALGESAQVLIDVIPELEKILGQQPPVPELSGGAAQNRFNLLFGKFVRVFTTQEHPLVIFLDDLQWADSASLNLLKLLMDESEAGYLLVLGAYRDNEVFPAHPLMLALDDIKKQGATLNILTLAPLGKMDITQLVADTLLCSTEIAAPLSELVYQKTQGNPFFTTQFLRGLHEDGCILFEVEAGYWQCDLTQVRQLALTDNVVEFMVGRLQKLPEATQGVLKLAACIGNQFDLATLAVVCEQSQEQVATDLWRSLQEGFVVPENETYKLFQGEKSQKTRSKSVAVNFSVSYRFLHDRIQQAAYSLIRDDRKQTTHYHIGQLLLRQIPPEAREERIFELVSQLNFGTALITEQTERDELAGLNLTACRRAKAATAYQAGCEYASTGLSLLGQHAWQRQYEKTLALHELAAELAYLCGDLDRMEQFIDVAIAQARSVSEKVNVYQIKIQSNVAQNRSTEAIAIAQQVLKQLGVTLTPSPTPDDIRQEIQEIEELIAHKNIQDFVHLPVMTDAQHIGIVRVASSVIGAAIISGSPLLPLFVCLSVKQSLRYGNTPASGFAYTVYGIILCNLLQAVDTATEFGQLALQVVSKLDAKTNKPEVLDVLAGFILHRKSHIKETLALLKEGYGTALEVGNLEYFGYTAHKFCLHSLLCGQPLATLEQETRAYCHGLVQLNQLTSANYSRIYWQFMLNVLGAAEHPSILSGEALQQADFLLVLTGSHDLLGLYYFYVHQMMLCCLFGEIESARDHAVEARKYLTSDAGFVTVPVFYFYDSLVALASLNLPTEETSEVFKRVEENQTQLQQHWADYAPMNHQHKVDLIEAKKYRVLGQKAEAIEFYDRALSGAKENGYIQEEALANELTAKFYLDWGKETVAAVYMQNAYYCYARWGAKAKIDRLEEQYPHLLTPILQKSESFLNPSQTLNTHQSIRTSTTTTSSSIDFISAIEASQALSEEIELDALLSKLMQLVLENAGADKGALILNQSGTWGLAAQCANDRARLCSIPLDTADTLPLSIINTVKRTQQPQSIDNLEQDQTFTSDPYLSQQPPKSLFCTPILNQGKLIGILYLENHLTAGAFTPDRIEVLNLLTAQAAISLENAQLYKRLEEYSHNLEATVEQRTQELQENNQHLQQTLTKLQRTQTQLIQAEKMSALGQMVAGIAHEINNPISFIAGNVSHARSYFQDLQDLLELYEEECPAPSDTLQEHIEDIDLEFVKNDLGQLLSSMKTGSDRIRQIVLGLRNFSRLDESDMKRVDIHDGLDNTVVMLQHRLTSQGERPEIEIHKHYGNLPPIHCWPSQLNQVFFNILTNAIDVLDALGASARPEIRITTEMRDDRTVRIQIADNGPGMNESIRQKVFDPFFTTKPVGQGTGLGLSISYQIVTEQHGGQLQCISQPGQGTEFVIEIPLSI